MLFLVIYLEARLVTLKFRACILKWFYKLKLFAEIICISLKSSKAIIASGGCVSCLDYVSKPHSGLSSSRNGRIGRCHIGRFNRYWIHVLLWPSTLGI